MISGSVQDRLGSTRIRIQPLFSFTQILNSRVVIVRVIGKAATQRFWPFRQIQKAHTVNGFEVLGHERINKNLEPAFLSRPHW